jgi:hypothetical protein
MKHEFIHVLPMNVEIAIDDEKRLVTLSIDHIDTSLLLSTLIHIEREHPIRLIDNVSHGQWRTAVIEGMYKMEVQVFDLTLACECTQLARLNEKLPPEFTITLRRVKESA